MSNNLTWERLDTLVESSLNKVSSGEFVSLARAVRIIMPDVLLSLRDLATNGTPGQRQRAIDAVFLATEKIRAHELKLVKANAMRERYRTQVTKAQAERARAKADEKVAFVHIAKERKKIQSVLNRHAGETA
jgi:hypothetical protein